MTTIDFKAVSDTIRAGLLEHTVPSLAVAVASEGEILWEASFGIADKSQNLASAEHIAYPVASVTKPMTATAVMRLAELGKLDIDAPANHYLPANSKLKVWVGESDELTIRHLLNHTAGLTTYSNGYKSDDRVQMPPQEESIRRYGHAVAKPGERYRYSNLGYGVLDFIVANVSGKTFAQFMAKEIFAPLGMHHSAIGLPCDGDTLAAVRYDEVGQPIADHPTDHAGASAAYVSAHDLLRFGLFHLKTPLPDQHMILSDASINAMHTPSASMGKVSSSDLNLQASSSYGLGFVIDNQLTPRRFGHGGGMSGCAAKLLLLPDEQIVVALVSNVFKPLAYTLEHDILEAMLPGYQRPKQTTTGSTAKVAATGDTLAPLHGDWFGHIHTYQGPMDMTLSVLPCGHVHARVGQLQQTSLVNNVQFVDGWFSGSMAGMIETEDANRKYRYPIHHLQLDLKLRGGSLTGSVNCITGINVGHWVELKPRKSDAHKP